MMFEQKKEVRHTKMKVLALQELESVSGAVMQEDNAAWSTGSVSCGGVTADQWSTRSRGCERETVVTT